MKHSIREIKKRDGRVVPFDAGKIEIVIGKAFGAVGEPLDGRVKKAAELVLRELEEQFGGRIPGVEDVQDIVETTLIEMKLPAVAKAYILYRKKRAEIREAKSVLGVVDELKLSVNAAAVLQKRYLMRNEAGELVETPSRLFRRVAKAVAAPERAYNAEADMKGMEEKYYRMMAERDFLPNSPTLMNAGTELGQLSACFVLPVGDSLRDIFNTVRDMAIIHQSGEGRASHSPTCARKGIW